MRRLGCLRVSLVVSVALVLALAPACGKNKAVRYADELADAVCACPDLACVEKVRKKGLDDLPRVSDATGNDADERAIHAAGARMKACQDKLGR
jgi:hypothetical protein